MNDLVKIEGDKRSIYGSLINGEGVYVGFSVTLCKLLNYVGINSKVAHGIGKVSEEKSGDHAWNAVEIDGKWYKTDLTWDLLDNVNLPYR